VGEAADRAQSATNLKIIGLALHNHNDTTGSLPPGPRPPEQRLYHSWQTHLLPYLEQDNLARMIDLNRPWDDPGNAPAFKFQLKTFQNPRVGDVTDHDGFALSHYAGSVEVFGGGRAVRLEDLPRGRGNTILAAEVAGDYRPWGYPANWRDPSAELNSGPNSFGGPSGRGAQVLYADGSVRFVLKGENPASRRMEPE
jgi:prepilin-type processing-associated H-X9-DG protein